MNTVLKGDPRFIYRVDLLSFPYGISGSGAVATKGKRKPRQEEDDDYREFPQKKHKLYGKGVTLLFVFASG